MTSENKAAEKLKSDPTKNYLKRAFMDSASWYMSAGLGAGMFLGNLALEFPIRDAFAVAALSAVIGKVFYGIYNAKQQDRLAIQIVDDVAKQIEEDRVPDGKSFSP